MRLTLALCRKLGEWSKKFANYPDRFVDRYLETGGKIIRRNGFEGKPQNCPKLPKRPRNYFFGATRPWSTKFIMNNAKWRQFVHTEPLQKWSFFRGDMVEILEGPDKGKHGKVKYIYEESNMITVENLNTKMQVLKEGDQRVAMRYEMPLLVTTQVRLVDPSDLEGTDIVWRYTEDGKEVRVSVRTGRIIPISNAAYSTQDYDIPEKYKNSPKDSEKSEVLKVTYQVLQDYAVKFFEQTVLFKTE